MHQYCVNFVFFPEKLNTKLSWNMETPKVLRSGGAKFEMIRQSMLITPRAVSSQDCDVMGASAKQKKRLGVSQTKKYWLGTRIVEVT